MDGIALVTTLHTIWSTGDTRLIDRIYAPDFVAHWPPSAPVPVRRGRQGVLFGVQAVRTGFPDWREEVQDIFAAGDRVTTRCICYGTHLGRFNGREPTGNRVEVHDISIFRIAEGRVAEQWCMIDEIGRLRQLGADADHVLRLFGLRTA